MANARKVKCPICNAMNNKEDTIKEGKRYYCPDCLKAKHDKQAKGDPRRALVGYLMKLLGGVLDPKDFKLIDTYHREYNMTYEGMSYTLWYWYDLQGNRIDRHNNYLGILPYVYKDAQNYYKSTDASNRYNKNASDALVIKGTRKVAFSKENTYVRKKIISIDDL